MSLSYQRKSEFFGFLIVVVFMFTALSLATHSVGDDRWIQADSGDVWVDSYQPRNMAGTVGALLSGAMFEWFGFSAWIVTLLFGLFGLNRFIRSVGKRPLIITAQILAGVFLLGIVLDLPAAGEGRVWAGGLETLSGSIGRTAGIAVSGLFGVVGGMLVVGSVLTGGILFLIPWKRLNISWPKRRPRSAVRRSHSKLPEWIASLRLLIKDTGERLSDRFRDWVNSVRQDPEAQVAEIDLFAESGDDSGSENDDLPNWAKYRTQEPMVRSAEPVPEDPEPSAPLRSGGRLVRATEGKGGSDGDYEFPPLDLLEESTPQFRRRADSAGADLLRQALQTFDIGIQGPVDAYPGPVITRYEFRPAAGVKVNQVLALADDIALALSASRVRIVAPVPGKAAVGIEVPNRDPDTVGLRRVLESDAYLESSAVLPLALGEGTDGRPFVTDLAAMPHLLIAGATGSGKSVCVNVIISSILFRHHPRDVRFLFIDPKRLELSIYSGIPHMAGSVVTLPKAAERLLNDAAKEMDERYKRLAGCGVRNIADYNRTMPDEEKLPYLIIVVDELADLMMSPSANRIELLITRLAQMARAVGIHLILATQRPSVDVITGLIKANFSCRIAFQVASKTDSRTILDGNGAEKLLGHGDMLFLTPGRPEPIRIHGALITGSETSALVKHLKEQSAVVSSIASFAARGGAGGGGGGAGTDAGDEAGDPTGDPLFWQAAEVVCRHKQGSVSLLQRRCGIGYQRAARLIDRLEESGIVGPYDGSKARDVLISLEDLEKRNAKLVG